MRRGQLARTWGAFSVGRALVELCTVKMVSHLGGLGCGHECAHFLRE
jgi:hypothetical protein